MKRETLEVQKEILKAIRKHSEVTLSKLERMIGTNPASLKKHCEQLVWLGFIKIKSNSKTTNVILCKK